MQCADPELQAAAGDAVVVPADLADELLRVLLPEAHAQDRSSARLLLHLAVFRSTCRPLRLVRLSAGRYSTSAGTWSPAVDGGAAALALAVASPRCWVDLPPPARGRRAWHGVIERARRSLSAVDLRLAAALSSAPHDQGPGLRLRSCGHRVQARWMPPAGARIEGGP